MHVESRNTGDVDISVHSTPNFVPLFQQVDTREVCHHKGPPTQKWLQRGKRMCEAVTTTITDHNPEPNLNPSPKS